VPQFLLRNFASGNKRQLSVFDKHTGATFCTVPNKLAAERDFYDFKTHHGTTDSIDPAMDVIDGAAASPINGIVESRSLAGLDEGDRVTISIFAATQMLRTKAKLEMWADMNAQMATALRKLGTEPNAVKGFKEMSADESRAVIWSGLPQLMKEIAPHIFSKSWMLYQTTESEPFYLGDNPLVMHNTLNQERLRGTLGVGVKGIEIYLPISTTVVLCFLCESIERGIRGCAMNADYLRPSESTIEMLHAFDTGTPLRLMHDNVVFQNSLQVANASRYVYCCNDDFDLAREMVTSNPELKNSPRVGMNR
jgi:hypothetical protein